MADKISNFWKKRADKLTHENKIEETIEAYDKYIEKEIESQNKDYWYKKGCDYFEILDWDNAIECFDNDLKYNEHTFNSLFHKAVSLYKLEKFYEAVECFNKAWESHCSLYMKYTEQSNTLTKFKEFEQAIEYGNKAADIDSPLHDFWLLKGLCLYKISKYDESKSCFENGLEETPDDFSLMYFLARSELKLGNDGKSLILLKKCFKKDHSLSKMLLVDDGFNALKNNPDFIPFLENTLL